MRPFASCESHSTERLVHVVGATAKSSVKTSWSSNVRGLNTFFLVALEWYIRVLGCRFPLLSAAILLSLTHCSGSS